MTRSELRMKQQAEEQVPTAVDEDVQDEIDTISDSFRTWNHPDIVE